MALGWHALQALRKGVAFKGRVRQTGVARPGWPGARGTRCLSMLLQILRSVTSMGRRLVALRPNRQVGRATHASLRNAGWHRLVGFAAYRCALAQEVLSPLEHRTTSRQSQSTHRQGWPGQVGRVPKAQDASSCVCRFCVPSRRWGGFLSLCDPTDKSVGPPIQAHVMWASQS
jgi:hypothetical protein